MAAKKDYYETLEIPKSSDEKVIKKAYRRLAKKYHPDSNKGNASAEQKFKEITEAYAVLSDPQKKKLYDQYGSAAFDGSDGRQGRNPFEGFNGFHNPGNSGSYQEFHFDGGNMDDFFDGLFGNAFHKRDRSSQERSSREYSYQMRGQDLHADVTISFDEAAFGCDKKITLHDPSTPSSQAKTLQVHIPAGIDTGKSVRLRGKGMPGSGPGLEGDLLLKVRVLEKSGFERKGADIYTTAFVPYTTAVLGGEARVRTLYGDVMCRVPEGTQCGSKIRLRGKGIPFMDNPKKKGDQYVTIQVQIPKHLSNAQKENFRKLEQELAHVS